MNIQYISLAIDNPAILGAEQMHDSMWSDDMEVHYGPAFTARQASKRSMTRSYRRTSP